MILEQELYTLECRFFIESHNIILSETHIQTIHQILEVIMNLNHIYLLFLHLLQSRGAQVPYFLPDPPSKRHKSGPFGPIELDLDWS